MYKFTITVLSLVTMTILSAIAIGGAEVAILFMEFAVRVLFPVGVLAVAGAVVTQ